MTAVDHAAATTHRRRPLVDIQSQADHRAVPIDRVGVSDLRYPITVLDRAQGRQSTTARVSMSVNLPHNFKGTHMSRFLEVLNHHRGEITLRTLPEMLATLKKRLDAESARVELTFPYFVERSAPVTGASGFMDYECTFVGEVNGGTGEYVLGIRVPVTSLCPCSKAISDYGAHNQRGFVDIRVKPVASSPEDADFLWIEELIEVAERSASAPVYPVLKREDERYVTMQAYDNPAFVEDIVRNVATRLQEDARVLWFSVGVENRESIHNHSAFAHIEWTRETK